MAAKVYASFPNKIKGPLMVRALKVDAFEAYGFNFNLPEGAGHEDEQGAVNLHGQFSLHLEPKGQVGLFLQKDVWMGGLDEFNIYKTAVDGAKKAYKREEYAMTGVKFSSISMSGTSSDGKPPVILIQGEFSTLIEKFTPLGATGAAGAETEYDHAAAAE